MENYKFKNKQLKTKRHHHHHPQIKQRGKISPCLIRLVYIQGRS